MIIERDGLTYVPIKTFARLSGIGADKVKTSIANGIIHHSYVLRIKVEDLSFKYRIFIRQDKARAYGEFMNSYIPSADMAKYFREHYGMTIWDNKLVDMVSQGYIPVDWCVFVYPNGNTRIVYIQTNKRSTIADVYEVYVSESDKRYQKENVLGQQTPEYQQPTNAVLFKPNPECEGFMLTPEQIEIIKLFRKYRENKEPLF